MRLTALFGLHDIVIRIWCQSLNAVPLAWLRRFFLFLEALVFVVLLLLVLFLNGGPREDLLHGLFSALEILDVFLLLSGGNAATLILCTIEIISRTRDVDVVDVVALKLRTYGAQPRLTRLLGQDSAML